jgi:regulator of sigma E protease
MGIILFLAILAVLVFVHELGHFLVAKAFGIRVDEFAIGFPPRVVSKQIGQTRYSLNLIPFGGYVSIYGENPDEESSDISKKDSFVNKPKLAQIAVLAAGVTFNVLFAWVLLSSSYMLGILAPVAGDDVVAQDQALVITYVQPGSAADNAGIEAGDEIVMLQRLSHPGDDISEANAPLTADGTRDYIRSSVATITATLMRQGETVTLDVVPRAEEGGTPMIGIGMERLGTVEEGFFAAIGHGFTETVRTTKAVFVGTVTFIKDAVLGKADVSSVSGPVGIAGMVGEASAFGLSYVITFAAFISINLAAINILPFPALDGGRILFILIEAIIRRPIPRAWANGINLAGFGVLMLLILVITVKDVMALL